MASFTGVVSNPPIGSGLDWVYDTMLPFTGADGFGVNSGVVRAWGSLDTEAGYLRAELNNAAGNGRATAYTHDLPTGVQLAGEGFSSFRALAAVQVWGIAPGGVPQPQDPGFYGQIQWVMDPNEHWKVERWTWEGAPGVATINVLTSGTSLGTFDWTQILSYVNLIADGRPIGYYEAIANTNRGSIVDRQHPGRARLRAGVRACRSRNLRRSCLSGRARPPGCGGGVERVDS